ncbi:MAG: hypothetical protein ACD_3C00140G0001, partial [uncultured bacterium (gcode 4)]
ASGAELINIWNWLVKNSLWGWVRGKSDDTIIIDPNLMLLMHMNWNYNNSWTYTWTITNNWVTFASPSTWWLSNSALFNWSSNYLNIASTEDLNFWTSDFTLDYWVNPAAYREMISKRSNWLTNWFTVTMTAWWNYVFAWAWLWWDESLTFWTVDLNTWTHIAIVRKWTNFYLYKNWILGRIVATSTAITANTESLAIWLNRVWSGWFSWYMDEVRIVKNVAKWDGNGFTVWQRVFTPSSTPY